METELFNVDEFFKYYKNDINTGCIEHKRKEWDRVRKTNIIQDMKKANTSFVASNVYKPKTETEKKVIEYREYPIPTNNKVSFYDIAKLSEEQIYDLIKEWA